MVPLRVAPDERGRTEAAPKNWLTDWAPYGGRAGLRMDLVCVSPSPSPKHKTMRSGKSPRTEPIFVRHHVTGTCPATNVVVLGLPMEVILYFSLLSWV